MLWYNSLKWQKDTMKTILGEGGRIVIPVGYRKAMGLKPGDELLLTLDNDELRVVSTRKAVARAQALVRKYVPEGVSLVDELIKERREEASRE
jgi:AbrB family looped-hinge helix DNA binding protein